MERVLVAVSIIVVALVVAWVLQRRRPSAPTQPERYPLPAQLDRDDFECRSHRWLVVAFTSATCDSCAEATARASVLASPEVGYQEVPWQTRRDLHDRYGIQVVPAIVVADSEGVVQASFVGTPTAAELWTAVAEVRGES